jgi:hypothetical protein
MSVSVGSDKYDRVSKGVLSANISGVVSWNVSDVSRHVSCVNNVCELWGNLPTDIKRHVQLSSFAGNVRRQKFSSDNPTFWARIEISNQHIIQTIASKPSQLTWYIQCMILDGLEGNQWGLCLAAGPLDIPLTCPPNHCFKTIPIHLIHPMHDFGWSERESMVSVSCYWPIWMWWDSKNSAPPMPPFEPESRYPTQHIV